jgi:hypothetical protein
MPGEFLFMFYMWLYMLGDKLIWSGINLEHSAGNWLVEEIGLLIGYVGGRMKNFAYDRLKNGCY